MKTAILKDKQFVFIIGAPRSGTTYLYQALSLHPDIASAGNEITLFSDYIAPFVKKYEKEMEPITRGLTKRGLPLVWNKERMDDFILQFIENVYSSISIRPEHKIILDKNPGYSMSVDLIHYYIPEAKFIHIIRDGRYVAYSWNKTWTKGFGNPDFKDACNDWLITKNGAKKASKFKDNYYELRYEDLLANPTEGLAKIFRFCSINTSPAIIQSIVQQATGDKHMVSVPDTSITYTERISGTSLWKIRLSKKQLYIAKKYLAKALISEGYEKDTYWGLGPLESNLYSTYFFTYARYCEVREIWRKIIRKLSST